MMVKAHAEHCRTSSIVVSHVMPCDHGIIKVYSWFPVGYLGNCDKNDTAAGLPLTDKHCNTMQHTSHVLKGNL